MMIKSIKNSAIIFLSYFLILGQTVAIAQTTAAILPQGRTQFLDNNGNPLSSGKVYFYIPSTTTFKTTWQDSTKAVANSNPVTLDASGRATIYGDGTYRQIVKTSTGNTIFDAVTASAGTGSGTTSTGDGDLVGTIKPWAGLSAPNQYAFAYGQELSRTTYATLFTAITLSQNIVCTSGSPTASGFSDTSQIPFGAPIESTCFAPGTSVLSKTSTTVTFTTNSSINANDTARIFPFLNGNGSTTFNLPDMRGTVLAARDNMGGTSANRMTSAYFGGLFANSIGQRGGSQSSTIVTANLPAYTPAGTISQITPAGTIAPITPTGTIGTITPSYTNIFGFSGVGTLNASPAGGGTANSQINLTIPSPTFTGNPVTPIFTGTATTPTFTGTAQGGVATPYSLIQPTFMINYIIKITPDSNSADASGVTSLQGMTGDIACGTGLTCTGNIISSSGSVWASSGNDIYNTNSGSVTIPITSGFSVGGQTSDLLNFFVNKTPATQVGRMLQLQLGKQPANLWTPGATGGTGIDFSLQIDTGLLGSSTREHSALSIVAGTQAGSGGATIGVRSQVDVADTGTWAFPGFGGATGAALYAFSGRGGDVFGTNTYARAYGAIAANQVVGLEVDTDVQVNGTGSKVGIQIVDVPGSIGTTTESTGLGIYSSVPSTGYLYGIRIGHPSGQFPLQAAGTMFLTSTGTTATGFDLSNITFSTANALLLKNAMYVSGRDAANSTTFKMIGVNSSNLVSIGDSKLLVDPAALQASFLKGGFQINTNAVSSFTVPTQTILHLIGGDATNTTITIDTFSTAAAVSTAAYRRARGTGAAFTAAQSTDNLGFNLYTGATAANTWGGTSSAIGAVATENFTSTAQGSKIVMFTTPNTTTAVAQVFTLSNTGGLTIGGTAEVAAGVISAVTGYRVNNAVATAGNVLRGNGTNFVASTLAASDISNGTTGTGAVALASSPVFVTPTLGAALATSINFGGSTLSTYTASTWTPTITTDATVGTPVYSLQVGSYEQIGRQVTTRFVVALSSWGGGPTGNVFIGGLPVTSTNTTNDFGYCYVQSYQVTGLAAGSNGINARVAVNATTAQLGTNTITSSGILNPVTAAQFGATGVLEGFCTYRT